MPEPRWPKQPSGSTRKLLLLVAAICTVYLLVVAGALTALAVSINQPIARPPQATDDAARAAATEALNHCAAATSMLPADCPQAHLQRDLSQLHGRDIHWTFLPGPGAVRYQEHGGTYFVSGPLAMTLDYLPDGATAPVQRPLATTYQVTMSWDRTHQRFVVLSSCH